jgi:hypothetical protein
MGAVGWGPISSAGAAEAIDVSVGGEAGSSGAGMGVSGVSMDLLRSSSALVRSSDPQYTDFS